MLWVRLWQQVLTQALQPPHETVARYGLIDRTRIDARVDCNCEPGTVHLSGVLSVLKLLSAAVNS
jgi:hypothetical protein